MNGSKITQIEIIKLFGMFNHTIKLNIDENITIIHGPNGVGKTTILKMLKDLFDKNFYKILLYKFDSMNISFENEISIKIYRNIKNKNSLLEIEFKYMGKTKKGKVEEFDKNIERHFPLSMIEEALPFLERLSQERWIDRKNNEILSLTDIFVKYSNLLPFKFFGTKSHKELPQELLEFLDAQKTHFIQTQRLFVNIDPDEIKHSPRHKVRQQTTIENYSNEMISFMKDVINESGSLSASLDRTFPNRLLTSELDENTSEKQIRERYKQQNEYRNRLMEAGLIEAEDPVSLPERSLNENDLKVLWHYLKDVDSKFKVYDELLNKIELFKNIINSRFSYKKLGIDRNNGFRFISDVNEQIPIVSLSSGEQHEVVLSFELIFKVPKNSLILIDEPELSLHVTWQHKFLDDLKKISKITDLYFIIATHSPSIVQNKRHLMAIIPNEDKNVR